MEGGVKRLASRFSLGASLQAVTGLRCIAASSFRVAVIDGELAPRLHRPALVGGGISNLWLRCCEYEVFCARTCKGVEISRGLWIG